LRTIDAIKAEHQATKDLNAERIAGLKEANDELSNLNAQSKARMAQIRSEDKGLKSRIADLNPGEKSMLEASVKAVRSDAYSREQLNFARPFLSENERDAIEKKRAARPEVQKLYGIVNQGEYAASLKEEAAVVKERTNEIQKNRLGPMAQASHEAIQADAELAKATDKLADALNKLGEGRDKRNLPDLLAQAGRMVMEAIRNQDSSTH